MNRWSQRPYSEMRSPCSPQHPAVAYLFLVSLGTRHEED